MYRDTMLCSLKHALYIGILIMLYLLQTNPFLFHIAGMRPLWIIPVVVAIAMLEGEYIGAFYGTAAGVLCDLSATKLFGLNSVLMLLCCAAVGLAVIYLMRFTTLNSVLLTGAVMLVKDLFCFYFYYAMWGYSGIWRVFVFDMIPELILTLMVTPPLFLMLTHIKTKFDERMSS
ncbi:MAG: rod shape-determining protein MreD [Oscillospiraceae bacterium]|nr:rod shape-determining protein MreD [Oscillospiraceae bacterium]